MKNTSFHYKLVRPVGQAVSNCLTMIVLESDGRLSTGPTVSSSLDLAVTFGQQTDLFLPVDVVRNEVVAVIVDADPVVQVVSSFEALGCPTGFRSHRTVDSSTRPLDRSGGVSSFFLDGIDGPFDWISELSGSDLAECSDGCDGECCDE